MKKYKKNNNIETEVKIFVETECQKPTSKYGAEPFEFHFIPVVKYSRQLARQMKIDLELITLAAWLHDIGSIIHGRQNHHLTSAKIADEKLKELNYPSDKIDLIKKCILNHRGSQKRQRKTIAGGSGKG